MAVKTLNLKKQHIYAALALCGMILLAYTASIASRGEITGWERQLVDNIYNWPEGLNPVFLVLTQLGSAWMVMILPLVAWMNRLHGLAARLFISGTVAFVVAETIKVLVDRPRPSFLVTGISEREAFITGSGFPSGHTTIATVVALTLLPYLPRKQRFIVPLWIIIVGLSRIYLGMHAPLDVIGGFGLGAVVVGISYLWLPPKRTKKTT
jgi:undecaprenyl-diphosphatase